MSPFGGQTFPQHELMYSMIRVANKAKIDDKNTSTSAEEKSVLQIGNPGRGIPR